jgi:hypothetical protein
MPAMSHNPECEPVRYETSAIIAWVLAQQGTHGWLWDRIKSVGRLEYDKETNRWRGSSEIKVKKPKAGRGWKDSWEDRDVLISVLTEEGQTPKELRLAVLQADPERQRGGWWRQQLTTAMYRLGKEEVAYWDAKAGVYRLCEPKVPKPKTAQVDAMIKAAEQPRPDTLSQVSPELESVD